MVCSAASGELWRGAKESVGARRAAREPAELEAETGAGAEAGMIARRVGEVTGAANANVADLASEWVKAARDLAEPRGSLRSEKGR